MSQHASAQDHLCRGREQFDAGAIDRALEHFRAANRLDPASAQIRSFFGLALGLCERRWEQALDLCRSAARDEFFDPVHYHNLARLHLAFGFKSEAVRLLRRALMIDPANAVIADALRELGVRRRPPLAFLRRQNALNRWLGKVLDRSHLRSAAEPSPTL